MEERSRAQGGLGNVPGAHVSLGFLDAGGGGGGGGILAVFYAFSFNSMDAVSPGPLTVHYPFPEASTVLPFLPLVGPISKYLRAHGRAAQGEGFGVRCRLLAI